MKLAPKPENLLERVALALNLAPRPLLDTQIAFTMARAIQSAAELGMFEALGKSASTFESIAATCGADPTATKKLLDCLVGIGYARWKDGKYSLTKDMRKWLLRDSAHTLVAKLAFQNLEWDLVGKSSQFVRTGVPLDFHQNATPQDWAIYQDGMRDIASSPAIELAKRLAVPRGATRLLDIGGSHGLYSCELCRRHSALTATILELPGAVDRASEIAAREGLGERVTHRTGDALSEDLGEATFDVVMANNLIHHFTADQNGELARRVARALSPGGIYAIGDLLRANHPGAGGGLPAVMDFYFALTSASGTWSLDDIRSWQRSAGLAPQKPIKFPSLPGWVSAPASK
ncbi:Dimerisation domain-containing protein [Rhodoblastus acidophilus]|uniref:Dimerisation domain-containing protein n=1 Tax=Rhodoblastus acidophilus TaxID=1074 RepID=A0A212SFI1_RHOAC|nr:class I SAM-dependent methyltransferase [Rhodoblastus acidophilus]SNB84486.1 Dimerisation domain-containing protein [Rhodoblastus acidophilus]